MVWEIRRGIISRRTERRHGDFEAVTRLAEKILIGDGAVFKDEVAR